MVWHAVEAKLGCIALTDHDTVAGVVETGRLCEAAGVEFIPGIELTAHVGEREVHILGYFIHHADPGFIARIDGFKAARAQRVADMVTKLQQSGVDLQPGDVADVAGNNSALGRLHVARALLNRGFIRHMDEAFHRFIGKGRPAFVPKPQLDVAAAVGLVHQFGGVAIIATPGVSKLDDQLDFLFKQGLDGLEVWHSQQSSKQSKHYLAFAEARPCLVTGGSDCHGLAKDAVLIGGVRLDYLYVEKLKEFHARTLSKVS